MSLLPNTTYYFRVKAVNSNSESEYSDTVAVTTLSDSGGILNPSSASAPLIKKTEPQANACLVFLELFAEQEDIKELKLTLSVNSDYSSPKYNNLTYSVGNNTTQADIAGDNYLVFEIVNLNPKTTYYGKIKTVNKNSISTETVFTFTTVSTVKPPVVLGVTDLTAISAKAQWNPVAGATSYIIDLATTPDFTSGSFILNGVDTGNQLYYDLDPLVETTIYYIRVRSKINTDQSASSNTVSFTTLDDIQTNSNLNYNLTNPAIKDRKYVFIDSFYVSWNIVKGADSYLIDISTSSNFSTFVAQDITVDVNYYYFSGLSSGTIYYVRVKAVNSNYESSYTNTNVTTLTLNSNLNSPLVLSPSVTISTGFILYWIKRSYADKYLVELSSSNTFNTILKSVFVDDVDFYIFDNLSSNTIYYCRVYALNNTETSSVSNVVAVTTANILPSITLNDPTELTSDSVKLIWSNNVIYIKYYLTVYKKVSDQYSLDYLGEGYFKYRDLGSTSSYSLNLFLESNTTYIAYITGETASGDTKESNYLEFTTKSQSPTIQLSSDGQYLEWSGLLNRLEVSTDKEFKYLIRGYPRNVNQTTASLLLSNILNSNISYFIRGYYYNGQIGEYSNTVNTFFDGILFNKIVTSKTTALISWKKNNTVKYKIQIKKYNGSSYIPISGHLLPVDIGTTNSYILRNLDSDSKYSVQMQYLLKDSVSYSTLSVPIYFETNKFSFITEPDLNTGLGEAFIEAVDVEYDRFRLVADTGYDKYLVEVSKRVDFLHVDSYFEIKNLELTYLAEDNTTYYIRYCGVIGNERTAVETLSLTTDSMPALDVSLNSNPVISSVNVLNLYEATVDHSLIAGAEEYKLEISTTNTFNLLDYDIEVTRLTSNRLLLSGINPGKSYFLRMYAYNNNSLSGYSNVLSLDTTP